MANITINAHEACQKTYNCIRNKFIELCMSSIQDAAEAGEYSVLVLTTGVNSLIVAEIVSELRKEDYDVIDVMKEECISIGW